MTDKTIMLVEDNPDDELLTKRALQKNNILNQLVVAHDGAEALELLFGTSPDAEVVLPQAPAVVLLDLNLPKVSGLEVLRRMRADERTRLVPVVILTSSREEQDLIEGYRLGASSYVTKPVDFTEFLNATRQLGLYWLTLNESPKLPGQ